MSFLKRLLASKEVRAGLGVLDELECDFDDSASFKLVRGPVERLILSDQRQFTSMIGPEMSARQWVLAACCNVAGDILESGEFHVYRGMLDPMGPGPGLLKIFDKTVNALVSMGAATEEFADKQRMQLRKNLQSVG